MVIWTLLVLISFAALSCIVMPRKHASRRSNGARTRAALLYAATQGNADTVSTLIAGGADVNARDKHGWTPLMFAAKYNANCEVTQLLIAAGANINARGERGTTPLMFKAAHKEDLRVVQSLIAAGADVNASNHMGVTVLMLQQTIIKMLRSLGCSIAAGAKVNIKSGDGSGSTALMLAAANGTPKVGVWTAAKSSSMMTRCVHSRLSPSRLGFKTKRFAM